MWKSPPKSDKKKTRRSLDQRRSSLPSSRRRDQSDSEGSSSSPPSVLTYIGPAPSEQSDLILLPPATERKSKPLVPLSRKVVPISRYKLPTFKNLRDRLPTLRKDTADLTVPAAQTIPDPQAMPDGPLVLPPLPKKKKAGPLTAVQIETAALNAVQAAFDACDRSDLTDAAKLAALKSGLERCYAWFNAQHVNGWLQLDPHSRGVEQKLRAMMDGLEAQHARLVSAAPPTEEGAPLQFRRGVYEQHRALARQIWSRLAQGRPPLRIEGTPEHRQLTLSRLVRMLETNTGIRLLAELTFGDKPIVISEGNVPDDLAPLVLKPKFLPSMAHPQLLPTGSAVGMSGGEPDQKSDEQCEMSRNAPPQDGDLYTRVFSPIGITTAAIEGLNGIEVVRPDGPSSFYRFGPGAFGSVVNLNPSGDELADDNGEIIHTPRWLTLAHELTHALHQIRGTASLAKTELFGVFAPNSTEGQARMAWHDPEELVVIQGFENAFRKEAGLRLRGRHAPAMIPALQQRMTSTRTALVNMIAVLGRHVDPRTDPDWNELNYHANGDPYHDLQESGTQQKKQQWCDTADALMKRLKKKYPTELANLN